MMLVNLIDISWARDRDVRDIFNFAGTSGHHDHAVREGDGLHQVVGDEDDRLSCGGQIGRASCRERVCQYV